MSEPTPIPTQAPLVALLRGINVSGRNRIPMPDLRALCAELGWRDIQSYIQSGNVVFRAEGPEVGLERELGAAISRHFGLTIPVIVRTATAWQGYSAGNPFPIATRDEPNLVMLALSVARPADDAAERLQERAANGERIVQVGDALWIHFAGGAGRSKLSPALLDRMVGSPVTMRNWRTVCALGDLLGPVKPG